MIQYIRNYYKKRNKAKTKKVLERLTFWEDEETQLLNFKRYLNGMGDEENTETYVQALSFYPNFIELKIYYLVFQTSEAYEFQIRITRDEMKGIEQRLRTTVQRTDLLIKLIQKKIEEKPKA